MRPEIIDAIRAHAAADHPAEACGFVVQMGRRTIIIRAKNVAMDPLNFWRIRPEEQLAAERAGTVTHVYHTHPNGRAVASEADKVACEASRIPFLIVAHPVEEWAVIEPTGYVAPLYGREFCYGTLDCYSFVRDWYKIERKIEIPDFERGEWGWWDKGENRYAENFEKAGFIEVGRDITKAKHGDALLLKYRAEVENHAAIFLDGMVIAHHLLKRLSCREHFSQHWQSLVHRVVRHRSLT